MKKSVTLILWVKLDIAIKLRSQTQIARLKIATGSHWVFSWLKVSRNFEVLINEITNSPWRVCICIVSVYLFIYLSIYLSIYLYLDMYASISLSIILYISPYIWSYKTVLFSDWTAEALAKTKYILFWKWYYFMVNIYFNWHFFVASKVYIITIKWRNYIKWHI